MTNSVKIGTVLDSYYGNGVYVREKKIVRMTKHSVFFENGQRESINTVLKSISEGLYKLK